MYFNVGGSKPVTIPVSSSVSSSSTNYFNRERFPSGSSSMANSLNNSFQLGTAFSKQDSIDQVSIKTSVFVVMYLERGFKMCFVYVCV